MKPAEFMTLAKHAYVRAQKEIFPKLENAASKILNNDAFGLELCGVDLKKIPFGSAGDYLLPLAGWKETDGGVVFGIYSRVPEFGNPFEANLQDVSEPDTESGLTPLYLTHKGWIHFPRLPQEAVSQGVNMNGKKWSRGKFGLTVFTDETLEFVAQEYVTKNSGVKKTSDFQGFGLKGKEITEALDYLMIRCIW